MAGGFAIAEGWVEVHADTSRIPRQIEDALDRVDMDRHGRRLGSQLGGGIGRGLSNNLLGGGGGGGIIGTTVGVMATKFGLAAVAGAGLGAVLTELSGAAGLLPAAGFAGGLAMGTLAVATNGFGDAIKNVGDPEKFAESIAKLSPNARSAATAVQGLMPAFRDLKMVVQDQFFAGLGPMFTGLANTYLPMVKSSMSAVAGSMNGMLRGIGEDFATVGRQADMKVILDASAGAVGNLVGMVRPLVGVFMDLAAVGAPMLRDLTAGAGDAAGRFGDFVSKARESGQLGEWIQSGIQAFKDLWTIGDLLFGTVTSLIQAFGGPDSLLGVLTLVAGVLNTVAGFIRDNISWLGPLALAIGTVTLAVKAWQTAQLLLNAILLMNPFVALAAAVVAIVLLIIMNWDKVKAFLAAVWDWMKSTASAAWNWIKDTVSGILTGIANFFTSIWNGIKDFLSGVWNGIKAVASSIWGGIQSFIGGVVNGIKGILNWFGNLGSLFSGWFNGAKNAAVNVFNSLVSWVAGIPGRILGALGNVGSMLLNAGKSLIMGMWDGIKSAFDWVKNKVSGLLSGLRNLLPFSPAKEGPFSGKGYTSYSGKALMTDFGKGMLSQESALQRTMQGILGNVQPAFDIGGPGLPGGAGGMVTQPRPVQIVGPTFQIAGNLDPTNPTAWAQALENLADGIDGVRRAYT